MTTVGALIDRTKRDWLEPADDQPGRLTLTAAVTVAATTLHFDSTLIGPEELAIVGPGTLIEVGSEEMIVGGIDEDANELTDVIRGANGTTAATHADGDFAIPNPLWRRRVIFDAICDGVIQLFPELYRVVTSDLLTVSTTTFTEVPAEDADLMVAPLWFLAQESTSTGGWTRVPLSDGDFFTDFPPSSTGKAFMVPDCGASSGYLTYRAQFARPQFEIDDLEDDLGVASDWEPIVMLWAVAYMVAGRELDLSTQERLSKQLEQQNYPAGTPSKIRDALLRYRSFLVSSAQDDLRSRYPARVSMRGIW